MFTWYDTISAYIITIHVNTMTLAEINHIKWSKILLSNEQDSKENNYIIHYFQNPYVRFKFVM